MSISIFREIPLLLLFASYFLINETVASPTLQQPPVDQKPIVVLCIDGGGVRGLIPALVIEGMEKAIGKPITEVADLVAGTSAGSIIAATLNIPNAEGKQKYSATEVVGLANGVIKQIFYNSAGRSIRTLGGLAGSKYSAKPLESFLSKYFGNLKVSDTVKPVLLTSVDLQTNDIFNFSTRLGKVWPSMFNLFVKDGVRASTAAPTFFKPVDLTLASGYKLVLADGGLVAMSPELLALAEARTLFPNQRYIVISLSTGRYTGKSTIKAKGMSSGSLPQMLKPLITTTLESQLNLSNELMRSYRDVEYYRIDAAVTKEGSAMDDVSDKNLQNLRNVAANVIATNLNYTKAVARLKELG
jgi:patatin-like phospholipase/acyl hydrolase